VDAGPTIDAQVQDVLGLWGPTTAMIRVADSFTAGYTVDPNRVGALIALEGTTIENTSG